MRADGHLTVVGFLLFSVLFSRALQFDNQRLVDDGAIAMATFFHSVRA